jgi:hypothetical protein
MAHVQMTDNNDDGGLLGKNYVLDFLTFMETDTCGAIGKEKSQFHIPIRSILAKKRFAMEVYKEFIKTSKAYFPSYVHFVSMIDTANEGNSFIDKSHKFCCALWGCMHH